MVLIALLAQYAIIKDQVTGGGDYSTTANYLLWDAVGLSPNARAASSGYELWSGFFIPNWAHNMDAHEEIGPGPKLAFLPPAPNPARGAVKFRFSLDSERSAEIRVYDVSGRVVEKLHLGKLGPGPHVFTWSPNAAGVFVAEFSAGKYTKSYVFSVVR